VQVSGHLLLISAALTLICKKNFAILYHPSSFERVPQMERTPAFGPFSLAVDAVFVPVLQSTRCGVDPQAAVKPVSLFEHRRVSLPTRIPFSIPFNGDRGLPRQIV
jgi:hypothetical protein